MQLLDPMRDPAWRSERARHLIESGPRPKQPRRSDDEAVKTYRRFCLQWRKGSEARRHKLFLENPGLYYAHRIHNHPDAEWRAFLEAKILAREPDEFIAADFSTCAEAVKWYHDLFFDVRDRLHSRMYITKIVLGPAARRIAAHDDVMTDAMRFMLLKSFAYFGGPVVLDVMITGFNQKGAFPNKPGQVDDWLDDAFRTTIRRRSNMSAAVFQVDRWKVMELMQIHVSLLAQHQQAMAAGGGTQTEFHQNIELFFDQVPMAIGAKSQEGRRPEFLQFEGTAVEPRASEMLSLSTGDVPDPLKSKMQFQRPDTEDEGHVETHGQEV